jgi:hypothetical protein
MTPAEVDLFARMSRLERDILELRHDLNRATIEIDSAQQRAAYLLEKFFQEGRRDG